MTARLDLPALLAPISEASPCGEDMLFSRQFDAIQEARKHDDPSLEQGEWVIELKEANWPFVISECEKLLRESTKDLRLAVWLTDALASQRGFEGLADGYRLLTGLCQQYWDQLHPLPEGGDIEMRVGNVTWLIGRSVELLQRAPIVSDANTGYGALVWETALALDQSIRRTPAQADELQRNKVTVEQFDRIRRATPAKFLQKTHRDVQACEQALAEFEAVFDERTASNGPSFRAAKDAAAAIRQTVERFAREAGVPMDSGAPAAPAAAPVAGTPAPSRIEPVFDAVVPHHAPAAAPAALPPGIHSRAQAIAQLKEVAAYFEKTEPSSPAAYMANKAARWADMPLHAWLRNVIKNEQELAQLVDLLDLPKSDDESR
ncbi:type VI secretion system protein ImpA [Variovorax boronicumulans]|uniref:type VI secretion system protein TssA n=1 Tax=Variovorax boronicumulans TaxID=436515 RepID=UPI0027899D88|nr:type VI secretion system protein TssA [Variovorax boronicumulans]MDP9994654.1 type VI secretion system protein ImpA [Variovorax boronicumulans]MDQ0006004.1 type VI secretion system protein ImpA [Variovorax boronicumulans]MDQ0045275.1 type VI secretion system protein ImpA [Variovorax boronicumulans]